MKIKVLLSMLLLVGGNKSTTYGDLLTLNQVLKIADKVPFVGDCKATGWPDTDTCETAAISFLRAIQAQASKYVQ